MTLIQRFLDPQDVIAHPSPLVTGRELMQVLQLSPSPQIGTLLKAIELAQAEGQIQTPAEAIAWAQVYVEGDRG